MTPRLEAVPTSLYGERPTKHAATRYEGTITVRRGGTWGGHAHGVRRGHGGGSVFCEHGRSRFWLRIARLAAATAPIGVAGLGVADATRPRGGAVSTHPPGSCLLHPTEKPDMPGDPLAAGAGGRKRRRRSPKLEPRYFPPTPRHHRSPPFLCDATAAAPDGHCPPCAAEIAPPIVWPACPPGPSRL